MASKRHRPAPRGARDARSVAHRAQLEALRRQEIDTEIQISRPRLVMCGHCEETFKAAELNPTCPNCGAILTIAKRMPEVQAHEA